MQILKNKKYAIGLLLPALLLVSVFIYYPLFATFYYSFFDWRDFSNYKTFVGLNNYVQMIQDYAVRKALVNTFIMMVCVIVFQVGIALVLALIVDSIKAGYKFFRTVFFFPVVISGTAIGLMFYLAYAYDYGLLNAIMTAFGGQKKVWVTENSALIMVLIPVIWQYVGFYFVIFLAALSKVPHDIYESALIDGITGIKKAIYITIPLIWDVITVCISLAIVGTFKVFDIVYVITGGGPMDASQVLGTYLYKIAFTGQNQGYASAIGVLIIVLGIILSTISNKLTERETITY
ncbi:binding-protein-dependent transport systems inner membrane component [Caldicellulosiruptor kronotskyensis 2002]|jgi:raffinose/stachyose/melibiose transport system permease protein|uniref:Binding-protein-dependent transport systems inner membrane component n=1 Tax=Caldicellulosiruptor kronotskyensis (strain DSM 18902 / VKM B-2412 / 2002) TaxID=632348 RepID=E4SCF7_CALK2|nr:sugar ABC transporter permease [Caldicellulosiruptor kronotskyensis]ADQ45012.1 binding-protein-dependent transport systems inner membrane component [Caldicellulosiruptor kronotskyensis 2002]